MKFSIKSFVFPEEGFEEFICFIWQGFKITIDTYITKTNPRSQNHSILARSVVDLYLDLGCALWEIEILMQPFGTDYIHKHRILMVITCAPIVSSQFKGFRFQE